MLEIDEVTEELRTMLSEIELGVITAGYSLADAIREGCTVSQQATGSWGDGKNACALTAAFIAAKARNLL